MRLLSHAATRSSLAAVLLLGAGAAQAHTGHAASSILEGLAHPLALDHLLAAAAVGVWSITALPRHRVGWGPAAFLLALALGSLLAWSGLSLPFVEQGLTASLVLLGSMMVMACTGHAIRPGLGLGGVVAAALLHGFAHGSEAPAADFAGYAVGFLLTTAALHAGGMAIALPMRRYRQRAAGGRLAA